MKKENKAARFRRRGARSEPVSELTTNRLSVYLRCLNALDAAGVRTVSSQALAEQFHLNAAQIRKDLAYFGEFGVRGVGYYVKELRAPPAADPRHRPGASASRSWAPATSGWRSPTTRASATKASRSPRCSTPMRDKIGQRRASGVADPRHPRVPRASSGASRSPSRSSPCRADGRAGGRQYRRRGGHQGGAEFLARRAEGAARRQAEERGPDRVAREPVVLSRAGRASSMRQTALRVGDEPRRPRRHVDRATAEVRMVDVCGKAVTAREAVARGPDHDVARGAAG